MNVTRKPPKKDPKARAKDQAAISFSLPKSLRIKIERLAEKENRTLSNWLVTHLWEIVDPDQSGKNWGGPDTP